MKYTSFLIKFLLFSTALYLLWIPFAAAYFSAILKITAAYFGLIGIEITLNPAHDYLYSQGIRSCIPPFIALVLATNLSLKKKALPKKITLFGKESFRLIFEESKKSALVLLIGIPFLFFFRVILQL
jgi:type IV secretory pathway TraG/TraD family ATPase VirD4